MNESESNYLQAGAPARGAAIWPRLTLAAIAAVAVASPAAASVITYTRPLDERVLAAAPPNVSNQTLPLTVTVPRLDPGVGILHQILVEYRFDCRIEADVTVGGGASGGFSGTFYADGNAFWSAGGGNDIGGPGPGTLTVSYPIAGSTQLLTPSSHPPAYSTFVGTGDMSLLFNLTSITLNTTGDANARLRMLDSSYLRVTYDYTPVPEPMAFALTAAGLLALYRPRTIGAANRSTPPLPHAGEPGREI